MGDLVNWLTSLPAVALVVGGLFFALLATAVARVGVRALVPAGERDHVPQIAMPLMSSLGAAFAIFAALSLASEVSYLRAAEALVSDEAAASSRLAWAATSPRVQSEPIHQALLNYLRTTRAREWEGAAAASGDDAATARAIARLERTVRTEAARPEVGTTTGTELVVSLDGVTSSRRARIAAASRDVPVLYVITLVVSGLALIVNSKRPGLPQQPAHVPAGRGPRKRGRPEPGTALGPHRGLERTVHRQRTSPRRHRHRPEVRLLQQRAVADGLRVSD